MFKQLQADVIALDYDGSYNLVAVFARDWKAMRHREQKITGRGAFVPLAFLRGEALQFDWSELSGHRWQANQFAGRAFQTRLQARLHSAHPSIADE